MPLTIDFRKTTNALPGLVIGMGANIPYRAAA